MDPSFLDCYLASGHKDLIQQLHQAVCPLLRTALGTCLFQNPYKLAGIEPQPVTRTFVQQYAISAHEDLFHAS